MKLRKLFLIICTVCFALALSAGIAACGGETNDELPVASVSLNKTELSLAVGDEETLEVIINPRNATNPSVEWSSSETSVATVEGGKVTAVAVGQTTITVTAGGKSATCAVTVTEKVTVAVTSVSLNHASIKMVVGETNTNLVPTILPANATDRTVTWTSSSACVTVSDKGHLTAESVGNATITATAGGKSATCAVTVTEKVEELTLSDEELELTVDQTKKITAIVKPEGLVIEIDWTSSNSNVAAVEGGLVVARAAGTAKITAKAGGKEASCNVTVKAKKVAVTGVSLNKTAITINVGDTETLVAAVAPNNATNKNVTWDCNEKQIATVDDGVVTALKAGDAVITVTTEDGGKSATCTVTVTEPLPDDSIVTYAHKGEESAAFEWKDTNASGAKVEYKLSTDSSYKQIDKELVRQITASTARADILGLKGGAKYDFRITSSNNKVASAKEVEIGKLDRSGYAHYNYSSGVGAYKDDGTLKANAKIIYLTEDNKNNVDGNGNSIAEYLKKAANNSDPIVIRVIGTVGSATWGSEIKYREANKNNLLKETEVVDLNGDQLPKDANKLTQDYLAEKGYNHLNYYPEAYNGKRCEVIRGLNSKASYKDGEYDSCWNDCSVTSVKNLTVEGVGEDAEIFQWGFTFKLCNSVEVRNIRFFDYTEDACSFEGDSKTEDSTTLAGFKTKNFWVHHNIFDIGKNYWDVCPEQDKHDGDGATDFKYLAYVTLAYNRYNGTHKTGLIGGGDSVHSACITFHHNYYNGCDQRMPLGRQANMHMYNNYYSSSGTYSISLRASAYAFIENCVFTSNPNKSTKPIELKSGSNGIPSAKVIDCSIQGNISNEISGGTNLYKGDDRNATVTGDNLYGLNFELQSDFKSNYKTEGKLATNLVASTIPNVAGTLKRASNIKIGDSTGDDTGGGDSGNTGGSSDNTDKSKFTFTVDDAVESGDLTVSDSQDIARKQVADGIYVEAKSGKVTESPRTIDGISFTHRFVLNKSSSSSLRYIEVTTGGAATIKVYLANTSGKDGDRNIGLYTDKIGTTLVSGTTKTPLGKTDTANVVDITVSTGGTYYLVSTDGELSIYAVNIVADSSGDNTGGSQKAEQSISYSELPASPNISGQFATGELFTASTSASATVTKDPATASAQDNSGKMFDYGIFPNNTGLTVTVTAKKTITLTIYYTVSNSTFATAADQSKSGNLVWTIDGNSQTSSVKENKHNAKAYCEVITLEKDKDVVFSIDSSSNRLVLFGLFAVEQ